MRTNPKTHQKLITPDISTYNIQLVDAHGNRIGDWKCPEAVNYYFVSVFSVQDDVGAPVLPIFDDETMHPISISPEGTCKLVKKL